jgi:hypothetical protein
MGAGRRPGPFIIALAGDTGLSAPIFSVCWRERKRISASIPGAVSEDKAHPPKQVSRNASLTTKASYLFRL